MAAAVAFYALLSIIPLVLVAVSAIGYMLGPNAQLQEHVLSFLGQFLPGTEGGDQLSEWLQGLIHARGKVGLVGLVGLLSTAAGGFATLDSAINVAWGTPTRGFVRSKVFAVGMVVVV